MEKRAILAIALSAAILILYQMFFAPTPPPPLEKTISGETPQAARESKAPEVTPVLPPPRPVPTVLLPVAAREIRLETPRFRAVLGTPGGTIVDWVVKYRGERSVARPEGPPPFTITIRRPGQPEAEPIAFSTHSGDLTLSEARKEGSVRLEGVDRFGLGVRLEFHFQAQEDRVEVRVTLENRHEIPQQVELAFTWALPASTEKKAGDRTLQFTRTVGLASSGLFRHSTSQPGDSKPREEVRWIGVESDDHYVAALLAKGEKFRAIEEGGTGGSARVTLLPPSLTLVPRGRQDVGVVVYVGPKEYDRLKTMGVGLEKSVDFGTLLWTLPMEWFSVPLLWLMNFIYRYTGNYGLSIILLTILTKICFYPLTQKSMTSMKQMQALQPQMNALRAKYKNDKQRLQKETMELYRKHGVNPMGGCLPIVIQIPIFYALYVTLTVSVELQQSPLLCLGTAPNWLPLFGGKDLWVCDLSAKDPTYLLPLLMGASMFIQQKMTPTVGDPRQAKIMLLLPVVFTFTFLEFPAGLVLYWLVNNVLSIIQQMYINRNPKRVEPEAKAGSRGPKETRKA